MRTHPLLLLLLATTAACAARRDPLAHLPDPSPPKAPFTRAVRAGDLLFLAGQLGTDSTGRLVSGGIEAETRQSMENIRVLLARHGVGFERLAKCTVFLADMAEWGRMNSVYTHYFPGPTPARTAVGVNGLALGARVEIECIAVPR